MASINYREQINRELILYEDFVNCEYGNNEEFVSKSCIDWILDDIEDRVNRIQDCLNEIYGLAEIDTIKDFVKELRIKLY